MAKLNTPDARAARQMLRALKMVANRAVPAEADSTGQRMVKVRRDLIDALRVAISDAEKAGITVDL